MRNQPNPGDAQGTCYTPPRSMGVLGSRFSTDRLAVPTWPANAGKQLLLAATPPARAASNLPRAVATACRSKPPPHDGAARANAVYPPRASLSQKQPGIAYDIASQLPLMRPSLDADSAHLAFCEGRCVRPLFVRAAAPPSQPACSRYRTIQLYPEDLR